MVPSVSFLWLAGKLPDETDHVRRGGLGLFQRQEMGCTGHVDQRCPIAQLLFQFIPICRRRDLIFRSLQDQVLGLSRRRTPGLEWGGFGSGPRDFRSAGIAGGLEERSDSRGVGRFGDQIRHDRQDFGVGGVPEGIGSAWTTEFRGVLEVA
jgi:hypothetical protein